MNFIKFFSIFLSTAVLASEKQEKNEPWMELFHAINNGQETLEQVQAVFEDAAYDSMEDLKDISFLEHSSRPEVISYLISKSVNVDPKERARLIRGILGRKLSDSNSGTCKLISGEPSYEIVLACLEEIKGDDYPGMNSVLVLNFGYLIADGNLDLAKKFVEAGFKIPPYIPGGIQRIKTNTAETIKFLIENGYDISREGHAVTDLMKAKKIDLADFQLYLDHGLPIDFTSTSKIDRRHHNWLERALETGDFDIAMLVYRKGLRLSLEVRKNASRKKKHGEEDFYSTIQDNIDLFIKRLAISACFDKTVKQMYTGNLDPHSILSFVPTEIIGEMVLPLCEPDEEAAIDELFVQEI